jgi:hypothetical protein
MVDPDRVLRMAYLPGEKVRVDELGFQWDGSPSWTLSALTTHFRRLVGSVTLPAIWFEGSQKGLRGPAR